MILTKHVLTDTICVRLNFSLTWSVDFCVTNPFRFVCCYKRFGGRSQDNIKQKTSIHISTVIKTSNLMSLIKAALLHCNSLLLSSELIKCQITSSSSGLFSQKDTERPSSNDNKLLVRDGAMATLKTFF